MKKLFLDVSFSKIYIIAMCLICFLILGGYFSYAMFTVSKEKSNAISIVTGNLTYELLVDGEESSSLTVSANSITTFTVTLNNPNNRTARFNFYYIGDLPLDVSAGYMEEDGTNIPPSNTGTNLEKVNVSGSSNIYKIKVVNNSDSEVTINLGVSVGLDYNDLSLEENQHLFEKSKLVSDVLLDNIGDNASTYDDGDDTFITGEEPNNYIWYSGKLWRAVSINNEEKTIKMITQWNISAFPYNEDYKPEFFNSHAREWLNDESIDGFLGNLRNPEDFIVMDSEWNATVMTDTSKPAKTTMVENAVGLLNVYEYTTSYRETTSDKGYLNNGLYFWLITPYDTSLKTWFISNDGSSSTWYPSATNGMRPVVNLKSNILIASGSGTEDDPYRLDGDNDTNLEGTLLNTRYSGEYIDFGSGENNLYRIVSHENGVGTKITSAEPLKNNGSFVTTAFGSNLNFSSSNTIGAFLNSTYLNNYLTEEKQAMIENTSTWYIGTVYDGDSYKLAKYTTVEEDALNTNANSKIGLLRVGELMEGQFDRYVNNGSYWTLTKYASDSIRIVFPVGYLLSYGVDSYGIKPAFNLKSNVIITGGTGTKSDPFTVRLKDEGKVRVVNDSEEVTDYLKYSDGSYVNVGDTIKIVTALNSNYVIDIYYATYSFTNGTNVQLYTNWTTGDLGPAQQFKINTTQKDNYYNISAMLDVSYGLDIENGSSSSGANIQMYSFDNNRAQKFSFVESDTEGYYYIKSDLGTCINVENGTAARETNINAYTCNQSNAQKWAIQKMS